MSSFKKIVLLTVFVMIGLVDICIYWNQHLYFRAEKIEDTEKKIKVLKRANLVYPSNDIIFYELGKAYFDLGIQTLDEDNGISENYLQKSIQNFDRSLRINPASRFSHFNYAQALLSMSYLSPYGPLGDRALHLNYYDEYKKAAFLAGHNSQIFYEAAKIFLSQWSNLSEEDREFALKILKKVAEGKDSSRLQTLMHVWEMNVKEYEVMEKILPEDVQIYWMYAKFLGEKSLSRQERQNFLAKAEFLEFERAKSEYKSGENVFLYLKVKNAFKHYRSCLDILEKDKFYQNLTGKKLVDLSEFNTLKKAVCLKLAKCRLEEMQDLNEAKGYLSLYLYLEDNVAALGELESYLRDRGLIGKKLGTDLADLDLLSFQVLLYFKQRRYRDIMRVGTLIQRSFIAVPESKKKDYVKVLQLIGDSYQKIDYLYDAAEFYQMALDVDPKNLETLLRMRLNHERLNKDKEIQEINKSIEKLLAPRDIVLKNSPIAKGQSFSRDLTFDGSKMILDLYFKGREEGVVPLISIFFNGRVVWEDYLEGDVLSIPLETRAGENALVVRPLNRTIDMTGLRWKAE